MTSISASLQPAARLLSLLVVVGTLAAGCTTTASSAGMVPHRLKIERHHQATLSLDVQGADAGMFSSSPVSDQAFKAAIEETLLASQLFTELLPEGGDYLLQVRILEVQVPDASLDMEAVVESEWVLTRRTTGGKLWMASLSGQSISSVQQAKWVDDRKRLSVEGAVRENIRRGMLHMAQLEL